ncbi:ABC transporter permease [Candidatus Acetothermia bacterium]|nr:ABC transporter permease [Candidatus Acetothermia bacterium]MCI2432345.1 ABC transporter permease [Candidatus Acetothermia bacterium]MCI2437334.1 ABC transporter permease [Candidatus Acetothermia bacterium]
MNSVNQYQWFWLLAAAMTLGLLWEIGVWLSQTPVYILPAPSRIAMRFVSDFFLIVEHFFATLSGVLLGFILALVAALLIALAIFYNRIIERLLYPTMIFLQNMPLFAIAPLLKLWLGFTIWPKIIIVALIAFFPMAVNTVDGLRATESELIRFFKILGASRRQTLWKLLFPSALPFIFSGMRVGVTLSVVGAVIGEWVGAQAGLGYLMLRANATLKTDLVFAAIFVLAGLGAALFGILTLLERACTPWRFIGSHTANLLD